MAFTVNEVLNELLPQARRRAGGLQARVRPPGRRHASSWPTRFPPTPAASGTARPTRSWTRTASAATWAVWRMPTSEMMQPRVRRNKAAEELHEQYFTRNAACSAFISPDNYDVAAHDVLRPVYALQHRGQESCGIVVNDDGLFAAYKDVGLVNDVFTPRRGSTTLGPGSMAVGHVRYGTTGGNDRNNAQPHCGQPLSRAAWPWPTTATWSTAYELRAEAGARGLHLPHDQRHRGHLLHHHQGAPARPAPLRRRWTAPWTSSRAPIRW